MLGESLGLKEKLSIFDGVGFIFEVDDAGLDAVLETEVDVAFFTNGVLSSWNTGNATELDCLIVLSLVTFLTFPAGCTNLVLS